MSMDILPEELKTNIRFVDEQHAQLLQIAQDIKDEFSGGTDREKLEELVDFLCAYAETHFTEEEELMLAADYPDFEAHKKEHDYFKYYIETVQHDIKNRTNLKSISDDVIDSLTDWIVQHVKITDVAMAKTIKLPKNYNNK